MVYVLLTINALLMLVMPILLGIWIAQRYKVGWSLFFLGTLGFILSQVGHLPFNALILDPFAVNVMEGGEGIGRMAFVALLFGLSAGVFEEVVRYIFYRRMKNARAWNEGLMFGAGWGSVESIATGLLAGITIASVYIYQSGLIESLVPADQLADNAEAIALGAAQIDALVSSPPYAFLLGALERFFALFVQLSLSILVLQVFVRRNIIWLFVAIAFHSMVNAVAVFGLFQEWDPLLIEAAIGGFAVFAIVIIRYFKPKDPDSAENEPVTATSHNE